jgi:site-specific DNA-methyltransferase (adenine-specific)
MGRWWDSAGAAYDRRTWEAALAAVKPGAHLVAFGGTRTVHRMTCAIEDAGWEIRDGLQWLYGSGFPKSSDTSKAIDRKLGAEREVVGTIELSNYGKANERYGQQQRLTTTFDKLSDTPATEEAKRWQGWGTALKPAVEPIVLARKPLEGTVAENVLKHGTGALNIDATRIPTSDDLNGGAYYGGAKRAEDASSYYTGTDAGEFKQPTGRWPANVLLDEAAAAELLDEQTGESVSVRNKVPDGRRYSCNQIYGAGLPGERRSDNSYDDRGGASRFFYCAKASSKERSAGLDGRNEHPTVKPIALMRWLVRLVTPPGGLVLDPFTGSGTTGIASVLEGFDFLGCELSCDSAKIARARIAHWAKEER